MKYLAAAALALFVAAPALAQQGPGAGATPPNQPAAAATQANAGMFVTKEGSNEWLVGNLWNKNVYDASGKAIGDLKDVMVGPDGKIQALVIGVGGFLGLGEKSVGVKYDDVKGGVTPNRITLNLSEQQLRAAPNFNRPASTK